MIRTGLAFLAIGMSLFRYFGLSVWTIFDGALVVMSIGLVIYGGKGYWRSHVDDRHLRELLAADAGLSNDLPETGTSASTQ